MIVVVVEGLLVEQQHALTPPTRPKREVMIDLQIDKCKSFFLDTHTHDFPHMCPGPTSQAAMKDVLVTSSNMLSAWDA